MLSIQNLTFRHKAEIFSGLNLEISRGDFIRLTGPNGCGKTSLLRLLAGLIPSIYPGSYSGKILYEGSVLGPDKKIPGICLTGPWAASRLFCRTVWEEVSFSPSADTDEAERLLQYFGLESLRDCHPQNLSGGQQQLVLICAYLSSRPGLLLLDECFAQLSEDMTVLLVKLLKQKHYNGNTIIMVEHKIPDPLKSLVHTVNLGLSVQKCSPVQSTDEIVSRAEPPSEAADSTPFFQTRNLSVKPDRSITLSYRDITLHKGMILHVHGPIGSGKSTLIRSLLSLGEYSGDIIYGGRIIRKLKRKTLTTLISAVLQSPDSQFFCTTVREEIAYTSRRSGRTDTDYLESACRDLGLEHSLARSPFSLSQGEKKKCQIASSLASDPDIILLDEPDAGLDEESTNQLKDIFIKLLNNKKIILFTSHNREFVDSLRQRIPYLRQYLMNENVSEV